MVRKFRLHLSVSLIVAFLAASLALARICTSYDTMSQTYDESSHIAIGMQWLDCGTYTYETLHPPLARAFVALLPYLDGARSHGDTSHWEEGNDILHGQKNYYRTLTLARIGILPFFVLSVIVLWVWTKKMFGEEEAMWAVMLFSLLPPILAHAGLATNDMPITAMFLTGCFVFWWWLQLPDRRRSTILGIVLGLAIVTKFSFLLFFPLATLIMTWYERRYLKSKDSKNILIRHSISLLGIVIVTVALIIWASYQFSFGPLLNTKDGLQTDHWMNQNLAGSWALSFIRSVSHLSIPAPEFLNGIMHLLVKNHRGNLNYFWGHPSAHGSPWFFPVALAVKTPLAFLLLFIFGVCVEGLRKPRVRDRKWLPILIAIAILVVCIPSNINIGLRHILPIYPFLAIEASLGAVWLTRYSKPYGPLILAALIGWIAFSTFKDTKDNLAYFNEIASSQPEYFLLDSDLDWGQDIDKLADTLKLRKIPYVMISYHGSADLVRHGFPPFDTLRPFAEPSSGWVAISKFNLYAKDGYQWLQSKKPVARVGNSILLYHM